MFWSNCANYTDERHQQLKNRGRKHLVIIIIIMVIIVWMIHVMYAKKIILTTVIELSDAYYTSASLQPPS